MAINFPSSLIIFFNCCTNNETRSFIYNERRIIYETKNEDECWKVLIKIYVFRRFFEELSWHCRRENQFFTLPHLSCNVNVNETL